MAEADDLRERIVIAAGRVLDRMRLTMAVMGAVRPYLAAKYHEAAHAKKKSIPLGPPEFMLKAQRDLHERLTGLFAPYADQLAVDAGDGRPRAAQPDLRLRPARARPVRRRSPPTRSRTSCSTASAPGTNPSTHLGRNDVDQAGAHLPRAVQAVAHAWWCCCSSSARSARCTSPS